MTGQSRKYPEEINHKGTLLSAASANRTVFRELIGRVYDQYHIDIAILWPALEFFGLLECAVWRQQQSVLASLY